MGRDPAVGVQQFVGINVIFYYSTTLWRSVGFTEAQALTVTVITSVTNVLTTLIAIALVDKVGRKPLLLVGSTGMMFSLATMAVSFTQAIGSGANVSLPSPWGPVALIAANAYVVFFGASWGPVVWVLLGEMYPNRIRAAGLAIAAAAQWLANFLVSTLSPYWPASGCRSPTGSTPRSPCCRSCSCSWRYERQRAASWRTWRTG